MSPTARQREVARERCERIHGSQVKHNWSCACDTIAHALAAEAERQREADARVAEAFGAEKGQRTYSWSVEQSKRIAAAIRAAREE